MKNPKRTRLDHVRILNPFAFPAFVEDGCILIEGETIAFVGRFPGPEIEADEIINLTGKTVLPGMINAHTHLYSAMALGMPAPAIQPVNFRQILENIWWTLDRALDRELLTASFEAGLLECLKAGVTTIFDHHSSPNCPTGSLALLAETAGRFGINISTAFEITDRNGPDLFLRGLQENLAAMDQFSGNPHVRPLCGLHASMTLSDASLKKIRKELSSRQNWGIHVHVSEDKSDEADAKKQGYVSALKRLEHFGLLNHNSILAHGLHFLANDIPALTEAEARLIHNPTSNANNRVGRLQPAIAKAVKAGLGTDGMQADMLSEARAGTLIAASHLKGDEPGIDYLELLFKNNPAIASQQFGRPLGNIVIGCQADLAIYDYFPRTALTGNNMAGHILFGLGQPSSVMTRGEFRIRDGKLVNGSESDILKRAQAGSQRLWQLMQNI